MKQLALFQMTSEEQSLAIAGQAKLEKQSNISSNITAGIGYFDSVSEGIADEDCDWGDIYDEYEDFEYCSRVW